MRILFLTSDFPSPWDPGRGPFNLALVRALRRKNHVRVVSPVSWIKRLCGLKRSRSASIDFELDVVNPTYFYPPKMARWSYTSFYWFSVQKAVRGLIRARRPDVVLAYWAHPDGAAAVRAAAECGAASAIIVGGSDVLLITRDPMRRTAVTDALKQTDVVITVNRHLRDAVIALGISAEKVQVWSQGVNKRIFRSGNRAAARSRMLVPPKARVLLWVGRLTAVKGVDVLLRAMPLVRARCPEARLYLVGDGELRRALEAQARQLQIADIVTFAGAARATQLGDWYRAADVTVLPSRSEGLPNVLRESIACGTPFVASRVGGINEIVRDGIDRLVEPEKPRALAEALIASLGAPLGELRPQPQLPSWDDSADALVKILESALKPASRAAAATTHRGRALDDLTEALVHLHS